MNRGSLRTTHGNAVQRQRWNCIPEMAPTHYMLSCVDRVGLSAQPQRDVPPLGERNIFGIVPVSTWKQEEMWLHCQLLKGNRGIAALPFSCNQIPGLGATALRGKTYLAHLIAALFLKVDLTAFGGPVSHVAMMEEEVVRRRWMDRETFLDLLGTCNLLPGPNSTEMAIHIGHARASLRGLVVAGLGFILPAALVTLAIAWGYLQFGRLPGMHGLINGIKPVVLTVVAQAVWNLGRSAFKTWTLRSLGPWCW